MRDRAGEPARLLVVDDNKVNRLLLTRSLELQGHRVTSAADGRLALEMLRREPVDLVLLDMEMPEMDGFQVLRRLRALPAGGSLPVVALTALTSDLVKERCEAEGMNDFVSKPVTLARVGELVAKWGSRIDA